MGVINHLREKDRSLTVRDMWGIVQMFKKKRYAIQDPVPPGIARTLSAPRGASVPFLWGGFWWSQGDPTHPDSFVALDAGLAAAGGYRLEHTLMGQTLDQQYDMYNAGLECNWDQISPPWSRASAYYAMTFTSSDKIGIILNKDLQSERRFQLSILYLDEMPALTAKIEESSTWKPTITMYNLGNEGTSCADLEGDAAWGGYVARVNIAGATYICYDCEPPGASLAKDCVAQYGAP